MTCVEIFEGMHQVMMTEISDVKKDEARKGDARTSTTRTSMNSTGKPNESKNYNSIPLSGQALP